MDLFTRTGGLLN